MIKKLSNGDYYYFRRYKNFSSFLVFERTLVKFIVPKELVGKRVIVKIKVVEEENETKKSNKNNK